MHRICVITHRPLSFSSPTNPRRLHLPSLKSVAPLTFSTPVPTPCALVSSHAPRLRSISFLPCLFSDPSWNPGLFMAFLDQGSFPIGIIGCKFWGEAIVGKMEERQAREEKPGVVDTQPPSPPGLGWALGVDARPGLGWAQPPAQAWDGRYAALHCARPPSPSTNTPRLPAIPHVLVIASKEGLGIRIFLDEYFSGSRLTNYSHLIRRQEQCQSMPGFGRKLNSIIDKCLSEYDAEATCFDEGVRSSKRKQLEKKLLQVLLLCLQISTCISCCVAWAMVKMHLGKFHADTTWM